MEVRGRNITVVGMGKSGLAMAEFLSAERARVRATDNRALADIQGAETALAAMGVPFVSQGLEAIEGAEMVVLSPGVPLDLPIWQVARDRGAQILGDVEVAAWFLRGPIIGITGSNGKTTTTALIGHLLRESGVPSQVGGNIGEPVSSMVRTSRDDQWNVLELSSFQLEMADQLHCRVAVALNVTPDHLDRHGTMENYTEAKARIFRNQTTFDFAVLNAENAATRRYAAKTAAQVRWFHAGQRMLPGFSKEEDILLADGEPWMPAAEVRLLGRHNIENVLAAACAANLAGADLKALRGAVATFPGVEHRIEFVRKLGGVDYYNDSKATNVDATIKSLESFDGNLWVILGGKDKGSDYAPLLPLLEQKAKAVLLIGAATEKIATQLGGLRVPMERCGDLATAVAYGRSHGVPGDRVLLAPACASFDQFKSYEHRGRVFKELVNSLQGE